MILILQGIDTTVVHHQGPLISSAAIIGIVIAVLFIIIIVIDVICCCAHKTGENIFFAYVSQTYHELQYEFLLKFRNIRLYKIVTRAEIKL